MPWTDLNSRAAPPSIDIFSAANMDDMRFPIAQFMALKSLYTDPNHIRISGAVLRRSRKRKLIKHLILFVSDAASQADRAGSIPATRSSLLHKGLRAFCRSTPVRVFTELFTADVREPFHGRRQMGTHLAG